MPNARIDNDIYDVPIRQAHADPIFHRPPRRLVPPLPVRIDVVIRDAYHRRDDDLLERIIALVTPLVHNEQMSHDAADGIGLQLRPTQRVKAVDAYHGAMVSRESAAQAVDLPEATLSNIPPHLRSQSSSPASSNAPSASSSAGASNVASQPPPASSFDPQVSSLNSTYASPHDSSMPSSSYQLRSQTSPAFSDSILSSTPSTAYQPGSQVASASSNGVPSSIPSSSYQHWSQAAPASSGGAPSSYQSGPPFLGTGAAPSESQAAPSPSNGGTPSMTPATASGDQSAPSSSGSMPSAPSAPQPGSSGPQVVVSSSSSDTSSSALPPPSSGHQGAASPSDDTRASSVAPPLQPPGQPAPPSTSCDGTPFSASSVPALSSSNGNDASSSSSNGNDAAPYSSSNGNSAPSSSSNDMSSSSSNGSDAPSSSSNGNDATSSSSNGNDAPSSSSNGNDAPSSSSNDTAPAHNSSETQTSASSSDGTPSSGSSSSSGSQSSSSSNGGSPSIDIGSDDDGPIHIIMYRYTSWPSAMTDFRERILLLIAQTAHVLGKPLPKKVRLFVVWMQGSALVGMRVTDDGERVHIIWEDVTPVLAEAEIIYWIGHDAVACDKESLWHIFVKCLKARRLIWTFDRGDLFALWEAYKMRHFFEFLLGLRVCPGIMMSCIEYGGARRLNNHIGTSFAEKLQRMEMLREKHWRGKFYAAPGFVNAPVGTVPRLECETVTPWKRLGSGQQQLMVVKVLPPAGPRDGGDSSGQKREGDELPPLATFKRLHHRGA